MISKFKLIDLSHDINSSVPSWTGSCGFSSEIKMDYDQGVRVMAYKCHAGVGTHIDAPSHFVPGGDTVADIPLEDLVAPAYVIDVSSRCGPDLSITPADLVAFEKEHGRIPEGAFVMGNTGWAKYWKEPKKYRNTDASNQMHFPVFELKTAELLMERGIKGLGIDTLTPELEKGFPIHHLILGAGKYIVENLANLSQLPPVGATVLILPIKVTEGSEAPVRAIALLQ